MTMPAAPASPAIDPAAAPVPVPDPAAPPAVPPATPPAPAPPAPADPPTTPPANETDAEKIARLEAAVKKANNEAGAARINAKKTAADEARAEFAKALGLVPDDDNDPTKLLEKANAFQAQAKESALKLAVFQGAEAANGDPLALLDSRAFLAKVAAIDPTDTAALTVAITEAVAENPRLGKAVPAAPVPGSGMRPNPAQGAGGAEPLGVDAQIAAATAAGNFKEAIRLKTAKSLIPSP